MSSPPRRFDWLRGLSAKVTIIACIGLLGTGLFGPGQAQAAVACDAEAVRALAGCPLDFCLVPGTIDIVCDASLSSDAPQGADHHWLCSRCYETLAWTGTVEVQS